jgi:hypothetical protein
MLKPLLLKWNMYSQEHKDAVLKTGVDSGRTKCCRTLLSIHLAFMRRWMRKRGVLQLGDVGEEDVPHMMYYNVCPWKLPAQFAFNSVHHH